VQPVSIKISKEGQCSHRLSLVLFVVSLAQEVMTMPCMFLDRMIDINRMTSPQVSSLGDNGIDRNHTILRQKECRILAIQTSPDVSAQYMSVMNCVFAAQKLNVCIDGCVLCIDEDSSFLQQACQLTRGIYCKPTIAQGYSHYFLSCFASDINSRRYIAIPLQKEVNYKVSCFCHHVAVNQGFVCSICLSVFCNAAEKCLVCGTDMSNKITIE